MSPYPLLQTYIVQFSISPDVAENEREMLALLESVPKNSLIVFPEGALSGYSEDSNFLNGLDKSELTSALVHLQEVAAQKEIHLTFGSCVYENEHWYNAAIYFGPGREKFIYRKINLAISERGAFTAGDELSCFEIVHYGARIKVAFQLCREIRFPEQWSCLARQGAKIFIYPTNAVGDKKQATIWRSHLVSRAAENQRFVLSANAAAPDQKCPSMAIGPSGEVQWEILSPGTEVGIFEIDVSLTSNWYLDQSRQDVVRKYG